MKSLVLALAALSSLTASADGGMIEVTQPAAGSTASLASGSTITAESILTSPTYRENQEEILAEAKARVALSEALSPGLRNVIAGEIDELPFHRIVDIEFAILSGFPDTLGVCLEGHPTRGLAIEACASVTIFIASLSANIKYRWDLVLHQTASGKIHQLSLGPGFGLRAFEACFFGCQQGAMLEAMGSLEYVYWISRHFGLTAQLDLGASLFLGYDNGDATDVLPYGKLTIGLAF